MGNYKTQLKDQEQFLKVLIKKSDKNLEKYKDQTEKTIRISYSNGCKQYLLYNRSTKDITYIKNSQIKTVAKIVQRDYEKALNKKLKDMYKNLERFNRTYDFDDIKDIYNKLPEAKKELVIPLIESDEQYIERWLIEHPGGQNEYPEEGRIYTAKGERVRSKSEKIIADLFYKYNIPYSYEPKLVIGNNHIINPDFVVLNVRTRKTIYWEHLGLIENDSYASKNLMKIYDYNIAGYELGEDLIISMETSIDAFDSRSIEAKIHKYCI